MDGIKSDENSSSNHAKESKERELVRRDVMFNKEVDWGVQKLVEIIALLLPFFSRLVIAQIASITS